MLRLQRSAGNRAVVTMLQRQIVGPLSAREVASAIRYYTGQPRRYTADIIRQIQGAVGATQTGVADEEMVQAVATWQQGQGGDPPLRVDGKAGPRTLPRMFANGLNAAGEGRAFGEAAQTGVIDRWHELTPQQRAAELVRLVNIRLRAAGVPEVTPNATNTGVAAGEFDFPTWQMNVGLPALSMAQPTRDQAADIADTIYHEARHAEQWFRMAQLRAGQGRTAAQIARELGIERRIADAAVAAPLAAGSMQALIAQGWYDSVYGSGSAHRERTLTTVTGAAEARDRAQQRFDANPSAQNQAALDRALRRFQRAHDAYRDLPEENDAWATGPMTGAGVTQGAPAPPVPAGPGGPGGPGGAPVPAGAGAGPGAPPLIDPLEEATRRLLGTGAGV